MLKVQILMLQRPYKNYQAGMHGGKRILLRYRDQPDLIFFLSQPSEFLPREYWEKLVAEAGYGPSLNLKDCSWPYVLLMRLGMYLLEVLVHAVKVPRNTLNPRLPSKLIPVLYHIYSFRSSWQVSLIPKGFGALQITSSC